MRKYIVYIFLAILIIFNYTTGFAHAGSTDVVISEVMTGYIDSLSREFVELYNNSDQAVALAGWTVEYKSATGKTWTRKASFAEAATLAPGQYIVVSTDQGAEHLLTSGMSQTGGNIRIRKPGGITVDQVAWGDGDSAEGSAVDAPAVGQSMVRASCDRAELLCDSDSNYDDFELSTAPSPGFATPQIDNEAESVPAEGTVPAGYSGLYISELFPDPQNPLSDSDDEFIELYNDSTQALSLHGWSLRDKTKHVYQIRDTIITPKGFLTLMSADTKLSLNNDGDEIFLVDPEGNIIDNTPNYGAAKPGLSWGIFDGGWAWLEAPTPNASNAGPAVIAAKKAETASKNKKVASKKTPKSSAKKPKVKKAKASKLASAKAATTQNYTEPEVPQNSRLWSWLLIGLGAGTIFYGVYAYKPEITHIIHQLRTKLGSRQGNW